MTAFLGEVYRLLILFAFFIISISIHECAHAYAAYLLGDPTTKNEGRITLNPLKHLDPLGTLMLFIINFGWAKPTPVNPIYFKDRRKGVMLSSLAGPLSNLLFAVILAFPYVYFQASYYNNFNKLNVYLMSIFGIGFSLNVVLAVFNMLPVPPLDGSKILSGIIPPKYYYKMLEYESYITIAFIILMLTGLLSKILSPIVSVVQSAIIYVVSPIIAFVV